MPDRIDQLLAGANAPLTDPKMNRTVGSEQRFELFHFALSLCSQKVRACLVEKGAGFTAHDINLQMPLLGNYDPGYVRLRLAGRPDTGFATGYTGRSSVASEGFDPAVVPTLVDLERREVVVDSLNICRHIDRVVAPAGSLMPLEREAEVWRELEAVDATPHVAVLYGAHPDLDFRPERLRNNMPGIHDRKIEKIKTARHSVDDPALIEAYDAKIAKEEAARTFVSTPDQMRAAIADAVDIIGDLDTRLADGRFWICGDCFTLADVFWSVSLFRMQWIGMAFAWNGNHPLNREERPAVAAYADRLFARTAFRQAVIDWPGTPRTEFVSKFYAD